MACKCKICAASEAGASDTRESFETGFEAGEAFADEREAGISEEDERDPRFMMFPTLRDRRRARSDRRGRAPVQLRPPGPSRSPGIPARPVSRVAPGFASAFQQVFAPRFVSPVPGAFASRVAPGFASPVPPFLASRVVPSFASPFAAARAPAFQAGLAAPFAPVFSFGDPRFRRRRRRRRPVFVPMLRPALDLDGDAAAAPDPDATAPPGSPGDGVEPVDLPGLAGAEPGFAPAAADTTDASPETEDELALEATGHCRLDSTVSEVTLYQPIALRVAGVKNETAIYLPPGTRRGTTVDLIVYFHGFERNASGKIICGRARDLAEYLRDPQFALREPLRDSGKDAILVVPKLGPQSQAGALRTAGGFARFIDEVLRALVTCGAWTTPPGLGKLVLSAHSGGGATVAGIVSRGELTDHLAEVWMFDAVYGQIADWKRFLAARQDVVARFAYTPGTSANHRALAAGARGPNVDIAPTRAPGHCRVPSTEMPGYLARSRLRGRTEG